MEQTPVTVPTGYLGAGSDSPCTGVCRLDPESGWCLGCGRTLEEISAWPALSPVRRNRVIRQLGGRRTRLAAGAANGEDSR